MVSYEQFALIFCLRDDSSVRVSGLLQQIDQLDGHERMFLIVEQSCDRSPGHLRISSLDKKAMGIYNVLIGVPEVQHSCRGRMNLGSSNFLYL